MQRTDIGVDLTLTIKNKETGSVEDLTGVQDLAMTLAKPSENKVDAGTVTVLGLPAAGQVTVRLADIFDQEGRWGAMAHYTLGGQNLSTHPVFFHVGPDFRLLPV